MKKKVVLEVDGVRFRRAEPIGIPGCLFCPLFVSCHMRVFICEDKERWEREGVVAWDDVGVLQVGGVDEMLCTEAKDE